MRMTAFGLGLALLAGPAAATGRAADDSGPRTIDLWPGPAPGETGTIGEESTPGQKPGDRPIRSLTNVSKPTLTITRPPADKDTGAAIVVCPGGGYTNLAWDHEGEQVAKWLNDIGVTAALLKYRVPRRPGTPRNEPPPQALMDAQRALSLVRSDAAERGIDPKRIGILGFSAGGHLGAWASTNSDRRAYEPIDSADKVDCRPDFAVLIYPGGAIKKGTDQLTPEIRITRQTPPTFLVHAADDPGQENSVRLYLALMQAGVPVELHIYGSGGHGFGMRAGSKPYASWPKRCEEWLRAEGFLKAGGKG